jgi:hypothetical protein
MLMLFVCACVCVLLFVCLLLFFFFITAAYVEEFSILQYKWFCNQLWAFILFCFGFCCCCFF